MKESQIRVFKDTENNYWFTAQIRNVYFLWRGFWRDLKPICQSSYEEAESLINKVK